VSPWIILVVASAFEVVMALGLKWSDGFTRLGGSAVAISGH
jgi:multidrug transporter EmrE-like cation transporter